MKSPSPFLLQNRRTFLRSASALLALPWLESIGLAKSARTAPPRFVTLYFPNGVYPGAYEAKKDPTSGKLSFHQSLAPLDRFASKATVIDGLDHPLRGHLGQTSGFLSAVDFEMDEKGIVRGATSVDQLLAKKWAADTFIPSLNLAMEPPSQGAFGNRPRSFGNSISWSSPTTKVEPQINPQQAFDQVFFGQTDAGRKAASRRQRIVDQVWDEAKSLQRQVSRYDQQKLEQYLQSIQDLQAKLEKTQHPVAKDWEPTLDNPDAAARPRESGIPTEYPVQMELLMDVMVLALQTDSTRVSTLTMGHSISRVVYDFVDASMRRSHHDLSHHRNDPKKIADYNQITKWLAAQTAKMMEKMDAIDEGEGRTLLDNSLVLFGSGMSDGNVHDPINIPLTLFGSAGGRLQTGRILDTPEDAIHAQLLLSLLHLFGEERESINGVTGQVLPGFA